MWKLLPAALFVLFLTIPALAEEKVKHTEDSLAKVKESLADESALIVDVREENEWKAGHLETAKWLPLSKLMKLKAETPQLDKLPKDKVIYLHCQSGGRVLLATPILKELGYDVRPLKFGFPDLVDKGFEAADADE